MSSEDLKQVRYSGYLKELLKILKKGSAGCR